MSNTGSLIPEYGNIVSQLMATTFASTGRGVLLESHFSDYMDLKEPFAQEHNSLWKVLKMKKKCGVFQADTQRDRWTHGPHVCHLLLKCDMDVPVPGRELFRF